MTTLISLSDVSFGFGRTPLFENLQLDLESKASGMGKVTGLVGPSGSGKSTLIKILAGVLKPTEGKIITSDATTVAYVPQSPVLFPHLSAIENARYFERVGNYSQKFCEETFLEITEYLSLGEVLSASRDVDLLSGGEKQRIMLLRSLSVQPDVLLLDEPTAGLDQKAKWNFLKHLRWCADKKNVSIVYSSHQRPEVEFVADDVLSIVTSGRETVRSIVKSDVEQYAIAPPSLEGFDEVSSVFLELWEDSGRRLTDEKAPGSICRRLLVDRSCIQLVSRGIPIAITRQNALNAMIAVGTQKFYSRVNSHEEQFTAISISGRVPCYDEKGILEAILDVSGSKVIAVG